MATASLFTPVQLGDVLLQHRVALAPLTRLRADEDHVPSPLASTYYEQRASTQGSFLITEATFIAACAGGWNGVPGIWSEPQIEQWTKITKAIHARGSYVYCQLWALGRVANRAQLPPKYDIVSSGDVQFASLTKPRPLTVQELDDWVLLYVQAARNSIRAGFDGVEIHSANGFLLDQFLQNTANNRIDDYGGSVENRIRFPLRIAQAVSEAIGANRVGIRLSPYERFQGMYMQPDDLKSTFSIFIEKLSELKLAYLHLTEPRVSGQLELNFSDAPGLPDALNWATDIWMKTGHPTVLAGGYRPEAAVKRVEEGKQRGEEVIIAFGRYFISNPDLPERIRRGIKLTEFNRATFYSGESLTDGYTDYSFAELNKS